MKWMNLVHIATFLMVSAITWGQKPIEKAVDKLNRKERIRAEAQVCSHINAMQPAYEEWATRIYSAGCISEIKYQLIQRAKALSDEDLRNAMLEKIELEFENPNTVTFQGKTQHCIDIANMFNVEIREYMVSNIYFDLLDCPRVLKTAEALGVDVRF